MVDLWELDDDFNILDKLFFDVKFNYGLIEGLLVFKEVVV